jgi:hypothetical protein
MSREVEIPDPTDRTYMKSWFEMGDTPEGLRRLCEYVYTTAPSRLSPSGIMCALSAAMAAMQAKDGENARLHAKLATTQQGQLFAPGGAS